jgi:hypothetical protein
MSQITRLKAIETQKSGIIPKSQIIKAGAIFGKLLGNFGACKVPGIDYSVSKSEIDYLIKILTKAKEKL